MHKRRQAAIDPLSVMFRNFATTVNEQRYPLGQDEHGNPQPWADLDSPDMVSVRRLALFHYVTRSLEDFNIKSMRAGGDGISKPMGFFESIKRCTPLASSVEVDGVVLHTAVQIIGLVLKYYYILLLYGTNTNIIVILQNTT
jgi:hypothetical protein